MYGIKKLIPLGLCPVQLVLLTCRAKCVEQQVIVLDTTEDGIVFLEALALEKVKVSLTNQVGRSRFNVFKAIVKFVVTLTGG